MAEYVEFHGIAELTCPIAGVFFSHWRIVSEEDTHRLQVTERDREVQGCPTPGINSLNVILRKSKGDQEMKSLQEQREETGQHMKENTSTATFWFMCEWCHCITEIHSRAAITFLVAHHWSCLALKSASGVSVL